ncbi:hypothetical protein [Aquabacterium sp.]|uniref:hypothetical protein n=1 Tax=Aquabacterium sp. TaxID=1872578 RepID=UPI0035B1D0EE
MSVQILADLPFVVMMMDFAFEVHHGVVVRCLIGQHDLDTGKCHRLPEQAKSQHDGQAAAKHGASLLHVAAPGARFNQVAVICRVHCACPFGSLHLKIR